MKYLALLSLLFPVSWNIQIRKVLIASIDQNHVIFHKCTFCKHLTTPPKSYYPNQKLAVKYKFLIRNNCTKGNWGMERCSLLRFSAANRETSSRTSWGDAAVPCARRLRLERDVERVEATRSAVKISSGCLQNVLRGKNGGYLVSKKYPRSLNNLQLCKRERITEQEGREFLFYKQVNWEVKHRKGLREILMAFFKTKLEKLGSGSSCRVGMEKVDT